MAARIDSAEFVDSDIERAGASAAGAEAPEPGPEESVEPAPEREASASPLSSSRDLDGQVSDTQLQLEDLGRQLKALEHTRKRRRSYEQGRQEMLQKLVRGVELLEESSQSMQRDSVRMGRTLEAFRKSLDRVGSLSEEGWTEESAETELTRALAVIEQARSEWDSALVAWPVLDPDSAEAAGSRSGGWESLPGLPFLRLCRLGLALVWPLAAANLAGWLVFLWLS